MNAKISITMNALAKKLLDQALALPIEDRSALVRELLDSLGTVEPEPQKEIERRALEAVRGQSQGRAVEDVLNDAREALRKQ